MATVSGGLWLICSSLLAVGTQKSLFRDVYFYLGVSYVYTYVPLTLVRTKL